jgi:hypothetical protein
MTSLRIAAAACAVLLVAGSAAAQPEPEGRRAFEEGVRLFSRRDYQAALARFEASRAVRETATVVFNIAGCLRALGKNAEALRAYERFEELRADRMDERQRQEVARARDELGGRVTFVTLALEPTDAEVTVDDRPIARWPHAVDPGTEVRIGARRQGYEPGEQRVRPERPGPLSVTMRLRQQMGRLRIDASEAGAVVRIDGREVGTTPWQGEVLPGRREVRVEVDGRGTAVEHVEVAAGQEVSRSIRLVPVLVQGRVAEQEEGDDARRPSRRGGGGGLTWVLVGTGVVAVVVAGAAAVLWATADRVDGDHVVELR